MTFLPNGTGEWKGMTTLSTTRLVKFEDPVFHTPLDSFEGLT